MRALSKACFLLLLGWFCISQLHNSYVVGLNYDDALNATVAKNLNTGAGRTYWYASSYHSMVPFDHLVTTGPTLIFPTAIAINLYGNQLEIPSLVATSLMLLALLFALWQLRLVLMERADLLMLGATVLLLLSFFDRNTWEVLLGDGLIALLIVNIALLLARHESAGSYVAAGLLAALAVLAKFYAIIALAGVFLAHIIVTLVQRQQNLKLLGSHMLITLFAATLLLVPWQLYKETGLNDIPASVLDEREQRATKAFRYLGSGLGQWSDSGYSREYLQENSKRNFGLLVNYLGPESDQWRGQAASIALLLAVGLIILAGLYRNLSGFTPACADAAFLMACACAAHLAWFFLVMFSNWVHYARIPVLLAIFCVPLAIVSAYGWRVLGAALLVFMLLIPKSNWQSWWEFASFQRPANPVTAEAQVFSRAIPTLAYQGPLAGCGWLVTRDIEYLLPQTLNFKDCFKLIEEQARFNEAYYLKHNPEVLAAIKRGEASSGLAYYRQHRGEPAKAKVSLEAPIRFALASNEMHWQIYPQTHTLASHIKAEYCKAVIYQNEHFNLRQCEIKTLPLDIYRQAVNYNANL